jgi:hypothetical protein
LYSEAAIGTLRAVLYPTPRTDRWDPWIVGLLAAALVAGIIAARVLL